ncbi:hypothetical protein EsH8_III_000526 [Colletotrichum jinshuiense]
MGGKVWSLEEEDVYWRVLIPQSLRRAVPGPAQTKSWDDLAIFMQSTMGSAAKRNYTGLGLFEHYFQNVEKGRVSPNASKYVHEYKGLLARAIEEEQETEIDEDDEATIPNCSHDGQGHDGQGHEEQGFGDHTGETAEEEDLNDEGVLGDITAKIHDEDKENLPIPIAHPPLGAAQSWVDIPYFNTAVPLPNMMPSFEYRQGTIIQYPTSSERTSLSGASSRPIRRKNYFRSQPYATSRASRAQRQNQSSTEAQAPTNSHAQHHGYQPDQSNHNGGQHCYATPMEYGGYQTPSMGYHQYGQDADQLQHHLTQFAPDQAPNFNSYNMAVDYRHNSPMNHGPPRYSMLNEYYNNKAWESSGQSSASVSTNPGSSLHSRASSASLLHTYGLPSSVLGHHQSVQQDNHQDNCVNSSGIPAGEIEAEWMAGKDEDFQVFEEASVRRQQ